MSLKILHISRTKFSYRLGITGTVYIIYIHFFVDNSGLLKSEKISHCKKKSRALAYVKKKQ